MVSFEKVWLCLFLIYLIPSEIDTYRVLIISPVNSRSHYNLFESIAKALAKKGHQIDVISHFEPKNPPNNFKTIINLNGTLPEFVNSLTMQMVNEYRVIDFVRKTADFGNDFCELMSLEKMQRLIKNQPNDPPYDLVITEATGENCYFGFGDIFKVPIVMVSPLTEFLWYDEIIGNPLSTAFAVKIDTKNAKITNFWERMQNTFSAHYDNYRFFKYTDKSQTEMMRKYLSPDISSIWEIEKNVALLLVSTYHSMCGIKPNTPAVVNIAGIHIEQIESQLTPELQIWMDESTEGVVFFTLGSMVIIEDFSEEILLGLYASFAKLAPTRVLIKILNKKNLPPGLPDNVLTMSWIPQIAVLRHKNTRLFITHGGLNSVQEAIYFGVPMIGIPLFGDQEINIKLLSAKNVAYELDYDKITEKSLDDALNIVFNNPKYREAAKRESQLFRDRPMSATDTAVFWIEYIIRNGANSLRSPAMDMKLWQVELLDVYGFFLLFIFIINYTIFLILKKVVCLGCNVLNCKYRPHRNSQDSCRI